MNVQYMGVIQEPDSWWLCTSKKVYDAWDLPEGPFRDDILSASAAQGLLYNLGPSSMTPGEVYDSAMRVLGIPDDEVSVDRDKVVEFIKQSYIPPQEEQ